MSPLQEAKLWTIAPLSRAGAVAGEAWDVRDSLVYDTPIRFAANGKDIANTLFWPTVVMLLARWTRVLTR